MPAIKKLSAAEFKEWLDGAFTGDPAAARTWCERTLSPNYLRLQAGGEQTDFERAVEKVTLFRTVCNRWATSVKFYVQEGNRVAARVICEVLVGDGPQRKIELMFMGELDDKGRFEYVWEQSSDYT
ncbi:hypothetical protein PISL3812_04132 [Talaromyces islandicus]|uniref:SnoaL-like domain-containing protein n=1 Tax=Talaromyces islandicus TaxID=28573 RepID=A0A0U1LUP1_TALIS|nr:hypothetical protein PISL3812_04132 [Talaromyces islandicus]